MILLTGYAAKLFSTQHLGNFLHYEEVHASEGLIIKYKIKYRCAPKTVGNMFQDLLRLCETADNTECYI
jgi:hypothetical protein